MRIGVVVASLADSWRDDPLVARRVSGTLADFAEVDLLVGDESASAIRSGTAVRVRSFPETLEPPRRRAALRRFVAWPPAHRALTAARPPAAAAFRDDLPEVLETAVARAQGGHSPALFEHLRQATYDAVVFVGALSASTLFGIGCVPARRRAVLVPILGSEPPPLLARHRAVFERADAIVCLSSGESRRLADVAAPAAAARVANVGFAFSVNRAIARFHRAMRGPSPVAVVGDWLASPPSPLFLRQLELLARELPEVSLHLAGRGAARLPAPPGTAVVATPARVDLWRVISKASVVVDPTHHQGLGVDVLAALGFGVPAAVSASGGATRTSVEDSAGGVWFRSYLELREALRLLVASGARRELGTRGRAWAERVLGDAEGFSLRLWAAVTGEARADGALPASRDARPSAALAALASRDGDRPGSDG